MPETHLSSVKFVWTKKRVLHRAFCRNVEIGSQVEHCVRRTYSPSFWKDTRLRRILWIACYGSESAHATSVWISLSLSDRSLPIFSEWASSACQGGIFLLITAWRIDFAQGLTSW